MSDPILWTFYLAAFYALFPIGPLRVQFVFSHLRRFTAQSLDSAQRPNQYRRRLVRDP